MVIPYTDDGRVLSIKDRKTGEWGFISGGVKSTETMLDGAIRELNEETSNLLTTIPSFHRRIEITTTYRPPDLKVRDRYTIYSTYYIYLFQITDDINMDESFKPNKEVIDMKLVHYDELPDTWIFCDYIFNKVL